MGRLVGSSAFSRVLGSGLVLALSLISAPAVADILSELHMQSDSFLSPAYDATPQSSFGFFGAHFKSEPLVPSALVVDTYGAYAFQAPQLSYLNVRELAVKFEINDQQTIILGRKLEAWNELDRRWNLGVIEPVFSWNPLEPQAQGLTGLFYDYNSTNFHLGLFGSEIYIPSQGPSYGLDNNGQFVDESPWFPHPPSTVRLFSEESQIDYEINTPAADKVVFRPSYGARIDFGEPGPLRARLAILTLPMNQLALPYTSSINIPTDRADVTIYPIVVYHNIQAGDVAYVGERFATGLSVINDIPGQTEITNSDIPADATVPSYSSATLWSPWVDFIVAKGWKLTLEHLQINGGNVTSTGPDANESQLQVTLRYPYREANQIAIETDTRSVLGHRVAMKTSYMQSDLNQFQFFTWQGRVELTRKWNVRSELQLVKAADLTAQNQNAIADNINNAQFMIGIGYVL